MEPSEQMMYLIKIFLVGILLVLLRCKIHLWIILSLTMANPRGYPIHCSGIHQLLQEWIICLKKPPLLMVTSVVGMFLMLLKWTECFLTQEFLIKISLIGILQVQQLFKECLMEQQFLIMGSQLVYPQ